MGLWEKERGLGWRWGWKRRGERTQAVTCRQGETVANTCLQLNAYQFVCGVSTAHHQASWLKTFLLELSSPAPTTPRAAPCFLLLWGEAGDVGGSRVPFPQFRGEVIGVCALGTLRVKKV